MRQEARRAGGTRAQAAARALSGCFASPVRTTVRLATGALQVLGIPQKFSGAPVASHTFLSLVKTVPLVVFT